MAEPVIMKQLKKYVKIIEQSMEHTNRQQNDWLFICRLDKEALTTNSPGYLPSFRRHGFAIPAFQ
jgi:hypothetical protein